MKQKHIICFLFAGLLLSYKVYSQKCGNCDQKASVALYDLAVQVPAPNDNDSSSQEWLKWRQLFWLSKHASAMLFQQNSDCIRFIQPSSESNEIKVGETATNLPSEGDVSEFGGYLVTGFVKKDGGNYLLHIAVETACSRKEVVSSDIHFDYSDDATYIKSIASQAVAHLVPLADKIRKFELEERTTHKDQSINSFASEPIVVKPSRKTLKPGESTEVLIELKDCDGTPLEGRELIFTKSQFKGLKIEGTTGGNISPAKVVTDAQGQAKVKFTLNSGAKTAEINVHSSGHDVRGCEDMFFGSALINVASNYSGYVIYSKQLEQKECTNTIKGISSISTNRTHTSETVQYKGSFESKEKKDESGLSISLANEEENTASFKGGGNYSYQRTSTTEDLCSCVCACNGKVTVTKNEVNSNGDLKESSIYFTIDEKDQLSRISLNLKFLNKGKGRVEQTGVPAMVSTSEEENDVNVELDSGTDPNIKVRKEVKPGKTSYTVESKRDVQGECPYTVTEKLTLVLQK